MAQIESVTIRQFRSVKDVTLKFPENKPLILIGENNTGKSNVISAIDVILGETYPTYKPIEENDYFHRDASNGIYIKAEFKDGSLYVDSYKKLEFSHVKNREQGEDSQIRADGRNPYLKKEQRSSCMLVYIPADRNISYQLSYSSKYTMLSKLMHRFHEELQESADVKDKLRQIYSDIKDEFLNVEEFRKFKVFLQEDFQSMISGMSHKLHIDLEAYNPTNFFQAIRILPKEGDEVRSFDELGTGEQEVLAISFAHSYAKAFRRGVILVIEEPESHLHPLAQKWLSKRIDKFCKEGLQVIFTTHSPNFVKIENFEGLCLLRKDVNGNTFVKQLTIDQFTKFCIDHNASTHKTTKENIIPFYTANTSPEVLAGFFSKLVVLVEGHTEAMALPEYLSKLGLDTVKEGIYFVPVLGKGNLARFYRLFKAFELPVYVIFDNDTHSDKDRVKREDICKTLGIDSTDAMSKKDLYVSENYAIFGVDFETTLRGLLDEYSTIEKTVREFLGYDPNDNTACKPLVARETARRILENFDSWEKPKKDKLALISKLKDYFLKLLESGKNTDSTASTIDATTQTAQS